MNTKVPVYPAVIFACLLGLVGLLVVWLRFTISIEPTPPETSSLSSTVSKPIELVQQDNPPVSRPDPAALASSQGSLRMSNQTDQPVRLALLARRSGSSSSAQPTYGKPAHWDFAPGEGSGKGLLLSLPDSNLKLKKGDILVAFAQDGSGSYWGPYVVGETTLPVWNHQTGEWQLMLEVAKTYP